MQDHFLPRDLTFTFNNPLDLSSLSDGQVEAQIRQLQSELSIRRRRNRAADSIDEAPTTRRMRREHDSMEAVPSSEEKSDVPPDPLPGTAEWLQSQENFYFFRKYPNVFTELQERNESGSPPHFLIHGNVQGGKTPVIAGLALYMVRDMRLSVVVVVRNILEDQRQLTDKFKNPHEPFHFFYSREAIKVSTPEESLSTFHREEPALTVALENQTQLQKIVDTWRGTSGGPNEFALIIDEADAIAFKGQNGRPTYPKVNGYLKELQDRARVVIMVTATSFDVLYLEARLTNRRIYSIPKHPNYKGVDHPGVQLIPVTMDLRYGGVGQPISPGLLEWYEELSQQMPFERAVREENGELTDHPIICLQKTETKIAKQMDMLYVLATDPRFRERFAILVYNGKGVHAYYHTLLPEIIPERGIYGKHHIDPRCNVSTRQYKKASIRDVLRMLRLYRNQYPITHIIIIAGFTVSRGLNIVSGVDYKWHLTHEIMYHSPNASVSDLIQSCRIFGIYYDSIPLKIYCAPEDAVSIRQAHFVQDRLIEGATSLATFEQVTASMPTLCRVIRICKNFIPARRTTQKCAEPEWNIVSTEEEQYVDEEEEKEELDDDEFKEDTEDDNDGSHIFRVLPERLGEVSRAYYNQIVVYLTDMHHTGVWMLKSRVLSMIYRNIQERNVIKSSIWNWTDVHSNFFEYAETEWESGLLIRQDTTGAWFMRLNEEEH
jgi:hypothetical protein